MQFNYFVCCSVAYVIIYMCVGAMVGGKALVPAMVVWFQLWWKVLVPATWWKDLSSLQSADELAVWSRQMIKLLILCAPVCIGSTQNQQFD